MSTIQLTMLAETAAMRKGIDDVNNRLGKMGKTASSVGRMVKTLAVGFVAFKAVDALKGSIDEASKSIALQDKLLGQTKATLQSTGGAAGVTANQILKLSDALEKKSLIDAEDIQAGQNMLLTFTNIRNEAGKGNDIFTQTTKIMTDLSTAMGQSTKSSALQLGKALNDPVKGISALSRVGVSFTQQQKDQVAAMVATGNTMGAQKLILAELNKEFGGSAKAAGDTFAGKVKHLKDIWDGFTESMVRKAIPVLTKLVDFLAARLPGALATASRKVNEARAALAPYAEQAAKTAQSFTKALLPALSKVGSILTGSVLPALASSVGFLVKYQAVVVPVAAGVLAMVAAYKTYMVVVSAVKAVQAAWIVVQTALNVVMTANPIGLIVLALVGLGTALVVAYKRSDTFRAVVDKSFSAVKNITLTVFNFVKKHIKTVMIAVLVAVTGPVGLIALLVAKNWSRIKSATQAVWNAIKAVVSGVIKAIALVVRTYFNIYKTIITTIWNLVKSIFSNAWNAYKRIVTTSLSGIVAAVQSLKSRVLGALRGIGSWLFNTGENLILGMINGVKAKAKALVDSVGGVVKSGIDKAKGLLGIHSPSKVFHEIGINVMKGLTNGLSDGRKNVNSVMGKVADGIEKLYAKRLDREKSALVKRLKAQKKTSKEIAKTVTLLEKKNQKATKAAIKGLGNETAALKKNAKKREAIYKGLAKAQEALADIKKAAADYKASVVSGVLDYTNITNLDSAFNSKALLASLQDRLAKVKKFADLIKTLIGQGLNKTMVDQLVQAGVEGGLGYAQAIADGGTDAIAQFNSLQTQIDAAANGLGTTAADSMYQSGIQAAQGLVDGLVSKKKALEKVARQLAKDLIAAIKSELKIKSPSRVFKAIGEFTLAGLNQGLSNTSSVTSAMSKVSNAVVQGYSPELQTANAASTSNGNVYITVNAPVGSDKVSIARELKRVLMTLPTNERRALVTV